MLPKETDLVIVRQFLHRCGQAKPTLPRSVCLGEATKMWNKFLSYFLESGRTNWTGMFERVIECSMCRLERKL